MKSQILLILLILLSKAFHFFHQIQNRGPYCLAHKFDQISILMKLKAKALNMLLIRIRVIY